MDEEEMGLLNAWYFTTVSFGCQTVFPADPHSIE